AGLHPDGRRRHPHRLAAPRLRRAAAGQELRAMAGVGPLPCGALAPPGLRRDRLPAPRALGGVGEGDFAKPALAGYDPAVISNATYAVSLEPEGGSPNGKPTEVLFAGKLVESVPPSP